MQKNSHITEYQIIFVSCSVCHRKLSCIVTFDIQKTAFLQNKLTEK